MVRLHEDVDGCGCLRCQGVDDAVVRRSLADVLYWSSALPFTRPSIVLVLGAIGLVQLAIFVAPTALSLTLVVLGVVGVFVGRGYIGVVGRGTLGDESPRPAVALRTVARRLPAFLGASAAIVLWLSVAMTAVVAVLAPGMQWLATASGSDPTLAEFGVLFLLAAVLVYTLLKCCFVPEAVFVGGYGPLDSLRVSWRITTLHRFKAALLLTGFSALLAVGVLLDTQLAGAGAPIALSFEVGGSTIVLRSFGLSVASSVRFIFDLGVTALYSGMFVHQYVESSLGINAP